MYALPTIPPQPTTPMSSLMFGNSAKYGGGGGGGNHRVVHHQEMHVTVVNVY
jgi:hypothetical protein